MSYPCLDCSLRFDTFDDAEDHHEETDHEIGTYEGGFSGGEQR